MFDKAPRHDPATISSTSWMRLRPWKPAARRRVRAGRPEVEFVKGISHALKRPELTTAVRRDEQQVRRETDTASLILAHAAHRPVHLAFARSFLRMNGSACRCIVVATPSSSGRSLRNVCGVIDPM